jgi:hypothetical protein
VNTRHTPGPWKIATTYAKAQKGHASVVSWAEQDLPIATIKPLHLEPGESLANAQLIAVAPDLLAACEAVAAECERQGDNEYTYEIGRTARAAIAAAKGEA